MTAPIDVVLSAAERLAPVRKSGVNWNTNCPAHPDKNPSLSISEGRNGNVVLHCFAGCEVESVVKALGLEMTDLFAEDKPNLSVVASSPMKLVKTYHYTDMNHKPLYEVRRYEPKTFRPYLPGASRAGLNGTERVLYRMPALIDALVAGDDVMIVEGERDVQSLEAAGYVATTNSGGSAGWLDSFADIFSGSEGLVVVVADNDPAGAKWAGQVAASLETRGVDYEVYQVPGEHGADITDHLAAGREIDELKDVEVTPVESDNPLESDDLFESDNPFERSFIHWPTFFDAERVTQDWFCEPILARGRGHALYAEAKGGKSFFTLPLACHVATGQAWLDMPAQDQRKVLLVDYEQSDADVWERMLQFGFDASVDLSNLHYALLPHTEGLDTSEGGRALIEVVQRIDAELVIIDTMSRAVEGEENSADTLRSYYKHTGAPLKALGVTVLRLDHAGKDKTKGARGTSAKSDDVDVVSYVKRLGTDRIEIVNTHSRVGWIPDSTKIVVKEDERGIMRHSLEAVSGVGGYPPGVKDDGLTLLRLGITESTRIRDVRLVLAENEESMSALRVTDAMRYIRSISEPDTGVSRGTRELQDELQDELQARNIGVTYAVHDSDEK